jgi:hypothetical protein
MLDILVVLPQHLLGKKFSDDKLLMKAIAVLSQNIGNLSTSYSHRLGLKPKANSLNQLKQVGGLAIECLKTLKSGDLTRFQRVLAVSLGF